VLPRSSAPSRLRRVAAVRFFGRLRGFRAAGAARLVRGRFACGGFVPARLVGVRLRVAARFAAARLGLAFRLLMVHLPGSAIPTEHSVIGIVRMVSRILRPRLAATVCLLGGGPAARRGRKPPGRHPGRRARGRDPLREAAAGGLLRARAPRGVAPRGGRRHAPAAGGRGGPRARDGDRARQRRRGRAGGGVGRPSRGARARHLRLRPPRRAAATRSAHSSPDAAATWRWISITSRSRAAGPGRAPEDVAAFLRRVLRPETH